MSTRSRIILVAAVAVLTACVGIFVFMDSVYKFNKAESQEKPLITEEEAVQAVLETTEVSADNATISRRELKYRSGKPFYKIQFSTVQDDDDIHFVCNVDGLTGTVLDIQKSVSSRASTKNEGASDEDAYDDPDQFIGVEKVEEIVLSDAGLDRDEAKFQAVRLNNRNNIMVYVAEFRSGEVEYKFFVDAVTGQVIERRVEYDDD